MELTALFKAVLEQDEAPIVLCDPDHVIRYMNPAAAKRYESRGGYGLTGKSVLACHNPKSVELIRKVLDWFSRDPAHNKVYTFRNEKENKDVYMIALRDDFGNLIGYYERHMYRTVETMKLYDLAETAE